MANDKENMILKDEALKDVNGGYDFTLDFVNKQIPLTLEEGETPTGILASLTAKFNLNEESAKKLELAATFMENNNIRSCIVHFTTLSLFKQVVDYVEYPVL